MKITSGRFWVRYSSACSADSEVSTAMPCCSSILLRITLADRESSTISARLPVIILTSPGPRDIVPPRIVERAFYLEPSPKPIPARPSAPARFRAYALVHAAGRTFDGDIHALYHCGHQEYRARGPSGRGQD